VQVCDCDHRNRGMLKLAGDTVTPIIPQPHASGGVTILAESTCEVLSMPVYDYICHDCNKSFETVLTLHEHDEEAIRCPHCGSKNVEQEVAAFFAVTGKKS
jgi:putative FmdB family regulatory protein